MANYYGKFLQSVERWPEAISVEFQRQSGKLEQYSYRELRHMAESVARWLEQNGVERGAGCAILAGNGPRWVAAYLGILAHGAVAVPLDTAFTAEQVRKLLADSSATLLLADARNARTATRATDTTGTRLVLLEAAPHSGLPDLEPSLAAAVEGFIPAEVDPSQTAAILYTSGTTSDPKGVELSHANFNAESEAVFGVFQLGPDDAILGVLPLFHALAQMANLLLPLTTGARVVFLESLNTAELLRALREREITIFACVPQFFYLIYERIEKEIASRGRAAELLFSAGLQLSGVFRAMGVNTGKLLFRPVHRMLGSRMRYLIAGGSRLDPAIGRVYRALGFELLQAYGLTETAGGALVTRPEDNVIGSVGKPLPGVELRIAASDTVPQESSGAANRPSAGEITIRGPIVMKCYHNRPNATTAVLRDGWLHTGDLGYLDSRGHLFITGRAKEVIVLSSGKNIHPEEIEAHYQKSPYIKEICVLGVQGEPGEPAAERLYAVVVPDFDLLRQRKIVNAREVIRFDIESLSQQLPSTKRILGFEIWQEDLPRTTTRKLKRFEIEQRVRERRSQSEAAGDQPAARPFTEEDRLWMERPEVARSLAVIRQAVPETAREIHPRDNLELDLGLDSMERVELLVALEHELGASVPDSLVSEVYSVRELVEAVQRAAGTGAAAPRQTAWEAILKEDPTDPDVLAVARPQPIAERGWFLFGHLVNLLSRDLFHLKVRGLGKLPANGPFILAPNHQSFLDPPILISVLPFPILKQLFYVGTSEIFGRGIARRLARSLKLIPVDPDAHLVPAMRAGAYGLRQGKILVLYPEGERSIDGVPRNFKKGAAILATHLHVPIYPVALDGFYEAWPRGKRFQGFSRLEIAFGDAIYPRTTFEDPEREYARLTAELKQRVLDLWNGMREPHPQAKCAAGRHGD